MRRVIILPDAEADIVNIWHQTIDRWGFNQAVKYDAMIQSRIEGLGSNPTASRAAEEVAPGLRRALAGSHVVFFREEDEVVTVLRVLHQGMDVGL